MSSTIHTDYYRILLEVCGEEQSIPEHIKQCIDGGADVTDENSYPLRLACHYANISVIKYLLTSPDIKVKPDIYALNSAAFEWLMDSSRSENEKKDILSFLILEYNLDYNKVKHIIDTCIYSDGKTALDLFERRFLKERLETLPDTHALEISISKI